MVLILYFAAMGFYPSLAQNKDNFPCLLKLVYGSSKQAREQVLLMDKLTAEEAQKQLLQLK